MEHLEGRIAAYARVQSAAIRNPLRRLDLDLELLLRDALTVLLVSDRQIRVEGPSVSLRARVAEQRAIAFHELATNALTYGALRSGAGLVALSWHWESRAGKDKLAIRWAETVAGPLNPEGPPGFGTEFLTRSLFHSPKADVDLSREPGGITWEIVLPDPQAPANALLR